VHKHWRPNLAIFVGRDNDHFWFTDRIGHWSGQGPRTLHLANFVRKYLKKYLEMRLQKVPQSGQPLATSLAIFTRK
jgi:hypothetical protein